MLLILRFFGVVLFCISFASASSQTTGTFRDTVVIGALDKVTARTSEVSLKVGETIKIGTLMIRAFRAWRSNPEETPESKVFFEITENKPGKPLETIFRGWMFSSAPSVSALEHPVYDIWVKEVSGKKVTGEVNLPKALDEETSEKIDNLIDQLMDQSSNDQENQSGIDVIDQNASGDLQKIDYQEGELTSLDPLDESYDLY